MYLRLLASSLIIASLSAPGIAEAMLGAGVDSVARDATMLRGTDTVTPNLSYDLHEIKGDTGTTVREYVSRQGTVFALSWEGRRSPDIQQLLGDSYATYLAAARSHRAGGHHLISITTPELVASVLVIQRRSIGHIHLPALLPASVAAADLR